jgi:hypothetical protein
MSDGKVPTITIRVLDREMFRVETDLRDIPGGPDYALNMLASATRCIEQARQDAEAISFQQKMSMAAQAQRALQKTPRII